jgi:hypothetical protein
MADVVSAPAPPAGPSGRRPLRLGWTPWLLLPLPAQIAATIGAAQISGADQVEDGRLYWSYPWAVTGLIGYGVLVLTALWAARKLGPVRDVLGLRRVPARRTALLVVITLVAVFLVNVALEPIFHGAERQAEQGGLDPVPFPGGIGAVIAAALAVSVLCVAAPVAEELFFRGLVHGALRRFGVPIATVASSGFFAAVHFVPAAIPVLFAVGVALALLYERTGSLIPGILVHACINSLATLGAFLSA